MAFPTPSPDLHRTDGVTSGVAYLPAVACIVRMPLRASSMMGISNL
jgi:hypothetical protein